MAYISRRLISKSFLVTILASMLSVSSVQAAPFDIFGSTTVDEALVTLNPNITTDGILAQDDASGNILIVESGVTVGAVDFDIFSYELFNRGTITGLSPGVFCGTDCTVNNDGFAAQIFGDGPAAVHIMGTGSAQVFNSGLFAEIEGLDSGVQIEGGGLVENSGDNATITGNAAHGVYFYEGDGIVNNTGSGAEIFGDMKGVWLITTDVADSVTQTVSNSGENSRIQGANEDGVNLAVTDSLLITQSVDNSGIGSIIISNDVGQGVDLYADGRNANPVNGTSITQTISNGGVDGSGTGALIEAEGAAASAILMQALDSLDITQTVDNSAADAIIRGTALGIDIFADGRDENSVDGATISQTVTNSGAGALIEGSSTNIGVEMEADDSLAITQLVDNSGAGAMIVGDGEGIYINADGTTGDNSDSGNTIVQTVLNSGTDASINSHTDEGVEIEAFDSRSITQLVDNSGAGAMIVGNDEGVELGADGRDSGSVDGVTISQTVNNSGASALIEGQVNNEGILMDAFDSLAITQLVNNSGSDAKIIGDYVGVQINADGKTNNTDDGESITQTLNNSGANAFIEGRSTHIGVAMDAVDSLAITQLVDNSGAGATIIGDGEGIYINADGTSGDNTDSGNTIVQTVRNSGMDASISSHTDEGVEIDAFDSRSITQLVDNSGEGATIVGNDEGVELGAEGRSATGSVDGVTIMQTVNNSGAGALIEGQINNEGILIDAFDSLSIMQLVTNSGSDAKIIGDDVGVKFNADGLVNNTDDGESIMQTITNSGAGASIEGRTTHFGIEMDAVDSHAITQLVDNSGAGARIIGDYDGINLQADGKDNNTADGATIMQTVNNSGADAFIEGRSITDGTRGITMDAGDSLAITQLVNNSGSGATIVGDSEGIYLDADGEDGGNGDTGDTINQTVQNSGADASIQSQTDEGVEMTALDSLSIIQLVENSGAGAKIVGNDEGVELVADGQSSSGDDGETISQTVTNGGAGALIESQTNNEGILLNAIDALAITQTVTNSGAGARIISDNDGINMQALENVDNPLGDTITQTVTNSGANARIESLSNEGIEMDALGALDVDQLVHNTGAGAEIIADSDAINLFASSNADTVDQTVNNTGAGSVIKSQNGIGVFLDSDGAATTQILNNTGVGAVIEGETFGISIDNGQDPTDDMITVNNGNVAGGGASIIANAAAGVGVSVNGNADVFNNLNSTIMGGTSGTGIEFLGGAFDNLFDNSGHVSCGVACTFAVDMGDGDDTVELRTGTDILGDIEAGAGVDTINLHGTGIFEHELLSFTDAGETLNMNGVDWELNSSGLHEVDETYINSGILKINNGTLDGDVFVESGGTLGGNGTITGNVDVMSGGTLAPGNSIDTITVGSQHFMTGSTLDIEFSDNMNDLVVLDNGDTTIDAGATVNFIPFGSVIDDTRTFTFVDDLNDTAVTGMFDTENAPLFFSAVVDYDTDCADNGDICVTLTRDTTYASAGNTPNQKAMGTLFDSLLGSPLPDVQALLIELDKFATLEEFNNALDQLSPEAHATMIRLALFEKLSFISTLSGRLDIFNSQTKFASNPGVQLAMTGLDPVFLGKVLQGKTKKRKKKSRRANRRSSRRSGGNWDAFIRPYGQFSTMDSEESYAGFDSSTGGVTAGLKGWLGNNINLGAAVGFSSMNTEFEGSDSEGDIDTYHGALFAGYQSKHWRSDAVFVYSRRDFEMARRVILGPINARARSEHEGEEISTNIRIAYDIHSGIMVLSPEFSLNYSNLSEDAFTETGAGVANMTIAETDSESLRTTLGLRAAFKSRLGGNGMTIVTDAHVHWAHEFMDDSHTISAQFVGFGGGTGVDIINRPLPADSVIAGLGVLGMISQNLGVSFNYDIQIGAEDFVNHTLSAGAEYRF